MSGVVVPVRVTLREYLEARNALVQAYLMNPTISRTYRVTKYARIAMKCEGKKVVVALRPKDVVETISVTKDNVPLITKMRFVCSHNMSIADDKMRPSWKNDKLLKWLDKNCVALTDDLDVEEDSGSSLRLPSTGTLSPEG